MAALLPDGGTSAARKQMFIRVVGGDRQRSCLAKRARASCYPGGKVERAADGTPLLCGKFPVGFERPAIAARPRGLAHLSCRPAAANRSAARAGDLAPRRRLRACDKRVDRAEA